MTRLLVVSAVALAAITFSVPAPAQAESQSKADGIRNAETTDFSSRHRRWRHRHWHHHHWRWRAWPVFPLAFAAPRYYVYPRYYYRPVYRPFYPRYRYWGRPGISISFGFGPAWWW